MPPDALEIQAELLRAAGALRLQSARPSIETACRSAQPALREAARAALASMDGKKVACEADPSAPSPPAAELGRLLPGPVKVQWMTDAGPLQLTLDPSLAPVAATRIAELVAKGFYSGIEVHRVVAGYVVQFGDPWGDGYGGAGLPPLRCETSPVPFVQGTVGVALGGRDTGSSQLFVTLSSSPHIDGGYAVIGKAEGPWDTLVQGDVIEKAAVVK
jgi:cyclophilin family peptidyl-prolyl cis-trans isomerase